MKRNSPLFIVIFLSYTNSFLIKRRKKELGLYNILGIPIAVGIGLSSFGALMVLLDYDRAALVSAQRKFTGINSFTLLAIPFFVLAGVLMIQGGIAGRLIDAA